MQKRPKNDVRAQRGSKERATVPSQHQQIVAYYGVAVMLIITWGLGLVLSEVI